MSPLLTNNVRGVVTDNLTATGTGQTTALLVTSDVNIFTTVATTVNSAQLPACDIGDDLEIINYGAKALSVYGQTGDKIQNGSANASFSVGANKTANFTRIRSTDWAAILSS